MEVIILRFTKMHGIGNDFILVNCFEENLNLAQIPELAVKACSRYFGIGADGLLLLLPSDHADIRMRIFNSDGSEPEMCGNGIRCAGKYIYEHNMIKKDKIRVETLAGIIIPELSIERGSVESVRVDMGQPRLERREIPMEGLPGKVIGMPLQVGGAAYHVTAVSMGNPHCVIFVPDTDVVPLHDIGPSIETHQSFPRKTNVEFIQVLNRKEVRMIVWERGAGETMACGTGACAAVVASALNGLTGREVLVHLKGGDLFVEWAENNHVYMTGPAEEVYTGVYPA
jgi:diaminopimelate epimerase